MGEYIEKLREFCADGFYGAVETAVLEGGEAAKVAGLCRERSMRWVCWASARINAEGLNLSSPEPSERERAVRRVRELMDSSAQAGADAFAILMGRRPESDELLGAAVLGAEEALCELAACAARLGGIKLLIEPLDRDAHKRGTIGPAADAARIIRSARREYANVGMVWDTAHMALQEGDPLRSLAKAADTVMHLHLCNAVLDKSSPAYGDYHILPEAEGGYLSAGSAARIMRAAAALLNGEIPAAVEARPNIPPDEAERFMRGFLAAAIAVAKQNGNGA